MPRLHPTQAARVRSYIELRYSHWKKAERAQRYRKVLRALKKASEEERLAYFERLDAFFERHRPFLQTVSLEEQRRQKQQQEFAEKLLKTLEAKAR